MNVGSLIWGDTPRAYPVRAGRSWYDGSYGYASERLMAVPGQRRQGRIPESFPTDYDHMIMNEAAPGAHSEPHDPPPRKSFRKLLHRMTSSRGELEAEELQEETEEAGGTPIRSCAERQRVSVCGTLRTVTLQPRGGVPAVEAELYDGSGIIELVWLGRRRIGGIEPGRMLRAHGLVTAQDGRKVMFNPRYELWPLEHQ